jgi:hypothetical protein
MNDITSNNNNKNEVSEEQYNSSSNNSNNNSVVQCSTTVLQNYTVQYHNRQYRTIKQQQYPTVHYPPYIILT